MVPAVSNGSVAWMNYALTGSMIVTIPLVIFTKMADLVAYSRSRRLNIDATVYLYNVYRISRAMSNRMY